MTPISHRYRYSLCFVLVALFITSTPLAAQDWAELDREDMRLAAVAERIQTANVRLCANLMPVTGMILHSADQYRPGSAEARFANGTIAVAGIVAGSPAALAGLQRDDALVSINGNPTGDLAAQGEGNLREAAFALLASQPVDALLRLQISRGGSISEIAFQPPPGCRSLVEILLGRGSEARSDGRTIQVRYDFATGLSDEQLAIVFAHELAHTVLEHRRRKEEAGIDNGLMAGFGRNQQANREAEIEADRLSVHLLANAGYDPAEVPIFWRNASEAGLGSELMPSFVYPTHEGRAQLIEREIARYLPLGQGPSWPGHLLTLRERSFSAD